MTWEGKKERDRDGDGGKKCLEMCERDFFPSCNNQQQPSEL